MISAKCIAPTVANIAKLSGGDLEHMETITGIECDSGYVTDGGTTLTCKDGTLTYSTPNSDATSCLGKLEKDLKLKIKYDIHFDITFA